MYQQSHLQFGADVQCQLVLVDDLQQHINAAVYLSSDSDSDEEDFSSSGSSCSSSYYNSENDLSLEINCDGYDTPNSVDWPDNNVVSSIEYRPFTLEEEKEIYYYTAKDMQLFKQTYRLQVKTLSN